MSTESFLDYNSNVDYNSDAPYNSTVITNGIVDIKLGSFDVVSVYLGDKPIDISNILYSK